MVSWVIIAPSLILFVAAVLMLSWMLHAWWTPKALTATGFSLPFLAVCIAGTLAAGTTHILVDDALWLDLVAAGAQPGAGAIWFYKLHLDPGVRLPQGRRDIDHVVSTSIMRQALRGGLPQVRAALEHSTVPATFGTGKDRIDIRAVRPTP